MSDLARLRYTFRLCLAKSDRVRPQQYRARQAGGGQRYEGQKTRRASARRARERKSGSGSCTSDTTPVQNEGFACRLAGSLARGLVYLYLLDLKRALLLVLLVLLHTHTRAPSSTRQPAAHVLVCTR